MPYDGCIHWNKKMPCKFCDANPKKSDYISPVPSLNNLQNFDSSKEWWNYYKKNYLKGLCKAYSKLINNLDKSQKYHFQFMTGNIYPENKAWDITIEVIEKLNEIYPIKNFNTYLNLGYIKKDQERYLKKLKILGFKNIQINLEVIGEKVFNETCPGKSKILEYNNVINFLEKATKVFGKGFSRSNFVFGLQENDELLKGINNLAKLGIVADYSLFIPKPGTSYSLKSRPDFNKTLNFSKELVKIYKKYNFEPIYDRYSSRSNALHELLKNI
jgi:biotin synthase-like enzyme